MVRKDIAASFTVLLLLCPSHSFSRSLSLSPSPSLTLPPSLFLPLALFTLAHLEGEGVVVQLLVPPQVRVVGKRLAAVGVRASFMSECEV